MTPVEERDLIAALRWLANSTEVPPPDAHVERVLLEAFDATWEAPRPAARRRFVRPTAAAALLALAATVAWMIASRPGPGRLPGRTAIAPLATTEFVVWPGAAELPTFESGHLMRVDLPVSALPSLGLVPPLSSSAVVQADVLVGQDGLPRAVRLSPDF